VKTVAKTHKANGKQEWGGRKFRVKGKTKSQSTDQPSVTKKNRKSFSGPICRGESIRNMHAEISGGGGDEEESTGQSLIKMFLQQSGNKIPGGIER